MNLLDNRNRVRVALLVLRVTVFPVMLIWTIDTFVRPSHAISVYFRQYLHPYEGPNILFFAAWPMLGACFTLYYLRDLDTLWTVRSSGRPGTH
jgi:hypothetical protein